LVWRIDDEDFLGKGRKEVAVRGLRDILSQFLDE
jgi:hypothetical protein